MDFAATLTILELAVLLVWTYVSGAPVLQKNATYDILITSLDVVRELLKSASLIFAPGLYDVLQADTPPLLAYFKSLYSMNGKFMEADAERILPYVPQGKKCMMLTQRTSCSCAFRCIRRDR